MVPQNYLQKEFGIEYDEGAEGINNDLVTRNGDEDIDMLNAIKQWCT